MQHERIMPSEENGFATLYCTKCRVPCKGESPCDCCFSSLWDTLNRPAFPPELDPF